jgi:uncharacterized protein
LLTSSGLSTRDAPEPLRAVLDTNVLVSALVFPGPTGRVWDLAEARFYEVFASPFLLQELKRNLLTKFGMSEFETKAVLGKVGAVARLVHPPIGISIVTRKDSDNRILECALEARAHVLVTGNMRDLRRLGSFQGIEILKPREFLDKYFSDNSGWAVGEGSARYAVSAGPRRTSRKASP